MFTICATQAMVSSASSCSLYCEDIKCDDGFMNVDLENQLHENHHQEPSLEFTPMTLAIRDLGYSITLPTGERKDLLHGIDAFFKPGSLTALMGSSGAGKTTLIDVIAGRKTAGTITGDIYVNGAPIDTSTYSRVTVSQFALLACLPFLQGIDAVDVIFSFID